MPGKENPRRPGSHDGGRKKGINNNTKTEARLQAEELAKILIDLQKRFPLFFYEPASDDPDLDMDAGFSSFGKWEVVI